MRKAPYNINRKKLLVWATIASGIGLFLFWLGVLKCACPSGAKAPSVSTSASVISLSERNSREFSICGRVTRAEDNGPVRNARVILDSRFAAVTDENGLYKFNSVALSDIIGMPAGNHFFAVIADDFRSKLVRQNEKSLAEQSRDEGKPGGESGCAIVNFSLRKSSKPSGVAAFQEIDANDTTVGAVSDDDQDGIDDLIEDWLAERFAPVVYHGMCERSYPVRVDWLLARTGLYVYDNAASPDQRETTKSLNRQIDLLNRSFAAIDQQNIASDSTRSVCKQSTYFLANVDAADQIGERDKPQDWITYVHSYGNQYGGVTIQYWRCYSYNRARFFLDFSHGGDWEAVAVQLDRAMEPKMVSFLGHTDIEYHSDGVQWDGEHPEVWSEEGGHASLSDSKSMMSKQFTRQESWTGGQVTWWDGTPAGLSGGLVNVGEKSRPRNGQVFVQYSGLWGSPGRMFITSGYWGPAFNETDSRCSDGQKAYGSSPNCTANAVLCGRVFQKAWCDGMSERLLDINIECYAQYSSR